MATYVRHAQRADAGRIAWCFGNTCPKAGGRRRRHYSRIWPGRRASARLWSDSKAVRLFCTAFQQSEVAVVDQARAITEDLTTSTERDGVWCKRRLI